MGPRRVGGSGGVQYMYIYILYSTVVLCVILIGGILVQVVWNLIGGFTGLK